MSEEWQMPEGFFDDLEKIYGEGAKGLYLEFCMALGAMTDPDARKIVERFVDMIQTGDAMQLKRREEEWFRFVEQDRQELGSAVRLSVSLAYQEYQRGYEEALREYLTPLVGTLKAYQIAADCGVAGSAAMKKWTDDFTGKEIRDGE